MKNFLRHNARSLPVITLAPAALLLASPHIAYGGIAFDNKVHQSDSGGAVSSRTVPFTMGSGANGFLVVFTEGTDQPAADRITGVTYAGVPMTQVLSRRQDSGRWLDAWVLMGPANGNNDVVISSSPADVIGASLISFTGVNQSNQVDSTSVSTSPSANTITCTTTVVASNAWLVGFSHGSDLNTGAGTTIRSETTSDGYVSGDSNGIVGTGPQGLEYTVISTGPTSDLCMSLAPAPAGGTSGSVIGGNYAHTETNHFLIPWSNDTTATEANALVPLPSGNASKLFVHLTAAPGAGHSAAITLRKNGSNTTLTCTVTGSATACSDTADAVTFADGDLLSVLYTEAGAANSRIRFAFEYGTP